ncbi:hypothetical protein [Algibacter mikhailovii]|uniref:Lipoprotein n=1 Tax=Algibacter mikhailovii TaxID=425498 RepID=A0A918R7R5_9FLAO|nr:hypothetical protein [Algibacter mikhailovii]GGZ85758.1 hypothetical protein GCM10007028_25030 [Algibacter mikhailovii]
MKNQLFKFSFLLTAMIIFGCSTTESENEPQSVEQESHSEIEASVLYDYLNEVYNINSKSTHKKSTNKDEKPFWTFVYSSNANTTPARIFGAFWIPDTDLVMVYDYPVDGQDRIHVNGDWGHAKWNIKQPRVLIADRSTGVLKLKYSNWCEENRTGFFKENLHGLINDKRDIDGDGQIDLWRIGVGPTTNPDAHGIVHVKTTLTDGQNTPPPGTRLFMGDCKDATTEVHFDMQGMVKNGYISFKVKLDGETYEWDLFQQ